MIKTSNWIILSKFKLKFLKDLSLFLQDIKLFHSFFAIPFAASALLLQPDEKLSSKSIFFITACLICARSFAMGINRAVDYKWDLRNPRTAKRLVASGKLSIKKAFFLSFCFAIAFILFACQLSSTAAYLSPFLLIVLGSYSYIKRYSYLCHLYLGLCLGLSPIAVTVALDLPIKDVLIFLSLAITAWIAAFDILYALQDESFDAKNELKSIPVRFGPKGSFYISKALHFIAIFLLLIIGLKMERTWFYYLGLLVIFILFAYQQKLAYTCIYKKKDKKILPANFFTANALVSGIYFLFLLCDLLLFP